VQRLVAAVLGTQSGVLAIFSWGNWGDMTDRFIGHPQSVESMVKVDEVCFYFFIISFVIIFIFMHDISSVTLKASKAWSRLMSFVFFSLLLFESMVKVHAVALLDVLALCFAQGFCAMVFVRLR
jgi:hypothetical protein